MKRGMLLLAWFCCCVNGTAGAVIFLQDGAGYWWDFDSSGNVLDGSPAIEQTTDAFDEAARLSINGEQFPTNAPQTTAMNDRMVVTGPTQLSGLTVTRRAYVPEATGEGWACFLEYLQNPTTADITVALRLFGNIGSDNDTTVTTSSSGDTAFTPDDRWVASDDNNNGGGDPSLSFNWRGPASSIVPGAVDLPPSQQDYYVAYAAVTVPAGMQVVVMYFIAQNANDAAARATAERLDTLPDPALEAIRANYSPILNWNVPDAMDVSPADPFTSSGQQGGPFTPASRTYLVRNTGADALDWSIDNPAWIALSFGFAPAGAIAVTTTINANANNFAPGIQHGALIFRNLISGVDIVRNIELTVRDRLSIAPAAPAVLTGFQGGPFSPMSVPYTLTNDGTGLAVQWSAAPPTFMDITPDSGQIAAGISAEVVSLPNAVAAALVPGTYTGTLTFHNATFDTVQTRSMEIRVSERLAVTPTDRMVARGLRGGPFVPSSWTYRITNQGAAPVDWSATAPSWLTLTPSSGIGLAGGVGVDVTAQVNASANALPKADYAGVVTFNNLSYGTALARDVFLRAKSRVFVNASVTSSGNGLFWMTAFKTIQEGIDAAAPSKAWVWVADGVYTEQIAIADGVEVYGGFAGGEATLSQRNPAVNVAVIDANAEGSVVTMDNTANAGIDGFTIQNGNAHDAAPANSGGGIRCTAAASSCFIANCLIRNNAAALRGAGISCTSASDPLIENCTIIGNDTDSDFGGGIGCYQSSPTIRDCRVCNNHGRHGAGIGCIQSSPIIANCIISGNWAASLTSGAGGGGVFAHDHSSPVLTNCVISGNLTKDWDGATLFCQGMSKPILTNCTLSSNRSDNANPESTRRGGISVNNGSAPVLVNCIIENMNGVAAWEEDPAPRLPENESDITVRYCLFFNNTFADFRDWKNGIESFYTGGDAIDSHVDGAVANVPGNPNPEFMASIVGAWTEAPTYDAVSNLTTLTSAGAGFTPGALVGRLINPDTSQTRQAFIVDNTGDAIRVPGDITMASGRFGYVDNDAAFAILDYHLAGSSPCVDAGDGTSVPATDLDGEPRIQHGVVDLGAYECAAPTGTRILSIERIGDAATGGGVVEFEVIFSRPIGSGFGLEDILIDATGGQIDAQVLSISGHDYRWIIRVAVGTGNGTLSIDIVDVGPAITDSAGLPVAGSFTDAQTYRIDLMRFTQQPQGAMKRPGQAHTFQVAVADAIGDVHYQWKLNNAPIAESSDLPALAFAPVAESDSGIYTCIATDDVLAVTSNTASLQVADPLSFVQQPQDAVKIVGDTYTFTIVTHGGFQPLSYLWTRDGHSLGDGTQSSLTLSNLDIDDTGAYAVTISDASNTDVIQSNPAQLTVKSGGLPAVGLAGLGALTILVILGFRLQASGFRIKSPKPTA